MLINKKSLTSKRMGIFLCSFQQNAGLNIFCQHTKQQKIENILCIWLLSIVKKVKKILVYKNYDEVLNKLKSSGFLLASLSIYYFATLYT